MRKQSVVLVFIFLLLLTISGQTTLSRLWALGNDNQPIHAATQTGSPARQPGSTFLTGPATGDPVDIALNYLRQQAATLGLHTDDLADLIVTDRYVTQHNGVTHLYLRQRYHGIAVFNGVININISRSGEIINLGNRFVPNLAQAVNTATPALTAPAAVEYAAQGLKLTLTAPVYVIEDRNGPAREMQLSTGGIAKAVIPAKLVYQRQADGKLHLAWNLIIEPLTAQHRWDLRIDAVTGAILAQDDLILHDNWAPPWALTMQPAQPLTATLDLAAKQPASPLAPPTYRVFSLPLEHPNDGPGLPTSQTLVKNPADAVASPYGWLDIDGKPGHDFTDTRGNNVFAQEDRNDDNSDGFRPTGKQPKKFNFDYPFDPALNPTEGNNPAVAIINLFYWNNLLHDLAYRYGFDEVSGNFQENNYQRGGLGADALQADVQDGFDFGVRNNAFFASTPDGIPPRLGMFVFDYTTPNRDSALDNGIVTHEYAHGISIRLVGGPSNPYCLYNAEQMGEGWSDWFTLALTTKANDTGAKSRGLGTYVLGQSPDGPGIRRYPYSTDMAIDPFTYADMRNTAGDIYLIGQIWGSMLWELQWNLIEQYGFDPNFYTGSGGNNLALRLVMDGMKLVPCDPGFVDARNALLTADQISNAGANQCTIWRAFAKRGLGASAAQGSPYNTSDGRTAFDLPAACLDELLLTKSAAPPVAEAGKVLTYTLVVANYLADPLANLTLRDPIPSGASYVAGSASDGGSLANGAVTWPITTMNPDEVITRTFQVIVERTLATGTILTNTATVATPTGESDSFTVETKVISVPAMEVAPTAFAETLPGGTKVTRELTIRNVGPAPLEFALIEVNRDQALSPITTVSSELPTAPPLPPTDGKPAVTEKRAAYTDGHTLERQLQPLAVPQHGRQSGTTINVLLLAAADVSRIQEILRGYPDLALVDSFDARAGTPTLEEVQGYDTVIVIANEAFADPVAIGNLLADYIDGNGTVIQSTPTFYDPYDAGWGLRGRFIEEGYSPFLGTGDWFFLATLGNFDALHHIMQGVTAAGDYFRQMVDLTPNAQWVASWTDDEFVATKGHVVALNTFLADSAAWEGDIPLIVHNSILWLRTQGAIDAPWLSVAPMTGTLADGGSQVVALTFDAGAAAIARAGDHTAILRVLSNDPHAFSVDVPITLHVVGPELSMLPMPSYFGRQATVPVHFKSNGLSIAATAFSVDFDERCLHFDPADADGNGIPDGIKLLTPPGFELVARANISDVHREIDLFIGDLMPPLTALPDGALVTIDLQASCQPTATPQPVRVGFGTLPPASFSDQNGVAIPGLLAEGVVTIQVGLSGDCNQDGLVNAADGVACVLESFDGDGSFWLDAPGGAFAGSPHGCDSNLDEQIDAGDILCTVLTIFQGQGACNGVVGAASGGTPAVAVLAIPDDLVAQPGGQVTVPVHLTSNGNTIGATVFALTFDPAVLTLDQTDGDGNGIPDAIAFNLPEGVTASVQVVDNRQIQIAIADLSLPFVTLSDGALVNITFTAGAQTQTIAITFAGALRASVGTHTGQSAAVTTDDGAVRIVLAPTGETLVEKVYLPWLER